MKLCLLLINTWLKHLYVVAIQVVHTRTNHTLCLKIITCDCAVV